MQVSAGYADSRKRILIANTHGLLASDEQVRQTVRISVVANGDAGMQTGFQSAGHTFGFEMFDSIDVEELARDAARQALVKLGARPAPSGTMPVVIKRGSGGVLFHEACGHGLEADLIAKGGSVYRGKQGELVASPLVTLVDDGTMSGEWGAIGIDDEGHPSQYNVLIEDGVLTDYMWDYLRARKEGRKQSGNGRRQSYMHLPMVRMTNTFVLDGTDDPDDIVRDTEHGVYVAKLGGGSVNTATGDFVFGMTEAYLIENGEITEPLREGNLLGQRSAGAARHRPARQRLRHGQPGHVRQGRPGRAGRRRPADAAGQGAHHRRHRSMSGSVDRAAGDRRPRRGDGASPASTSRRSCRATPRPTSASTRARSSTSSPPRPRGRHPGHPRRPHRLRLRRRARRGRGRRGAGRGTRQRPVRHPRRVGRARRARWCRGDRTGAVERRARRVPHRRQDRAWPRSSSG